MLTTPSTDSLFHFVLSGNCKKTPRPGHLHFSSAGAACRCHVAAATLSAKDSVHTTSRTPAFPWWPSHHTTAAALGSPAPSPGAPATGRSPPEGRKEDVAQIDSHLLIGHRVKTRNATEHSEWCNESQSINLSSEVRRSLWCSACNRFHAAWLMRWFCSIVPKQRWIEGQGIVCFTKTLSLQVKMQQKKKKKTSKTQLKTENTTTSTG